MTGPPEHHWKPPDVETPCATHGGGSFKLGVHTTFKKTPLSNLYLTMLQTAGVPTKAFADSTEPLNLA